MSEVIRRVVIQGRVQGVGYRAFVEHEAMTRKLEGWVRNRRDGSVEALFAGSEATVTAMIAACRRGPSVAKVDRVADEAASSGELNARYPGEGFSVLPTL
jgi:acylphosphatase